jgi:hypothetical protein
MDLSNYKVPEKNTGREQSRKDILLMFYRKLNEGRGSYPVIKVVTVASKLKHLNEWDMEKFYQDCLQRKNFNAYFWWALDSSKNKKV